MVCGAHAAQLPSLVRRRTSPHIFSPNTKGERRINGAVLVLSFRKSTTGMKDDKDETLGPVHSAGVHNTTHGFHNVVPVQRSQRERREGSFVKPINDWPMLLFQ
ncbi:hypothetical protein OUZ56_008927 [Daphnia magna]|uniref:Uncharacterized protein n=1 Tax=Daphnia magna TaxID=35525 RepID=A0ABR0AEH7_9CRUS|nr:hypothetical protein OUZ56_008927 [Daphnia magna]